MSTYYCSISFVTKMLRPHVPDRCCCEGHHMEKPEPVPIPMHLDCPNCKMPHEDKVDEATGIDWATRPHKTHLCLYCGELWRPYPFPTVGIAPWLEVPKEPPPP